MLASNHTQQDYNNYFVPRIMHNITSKSDISLDPQIAAAATFFRKKLIARRHNSAKKDG